MAESDSAYPSLLHTVIDCTDIRGIAEFYRRLLGMRYRPGDEPPADGRPDDADWLVLTDSADRPVLAFQQVEALPRSTWPGIDVPQQLHLDLTVPDVAELHRQRARAEELGAALLLDSSGEPTEALFVFADPEGHPFCIFVG